MPTLQERRGAEDSEAGARRRGKGRNPSPFRLLRRIRDGLRHGEVDRHLDGREMVLFASSLPGDLERRLYRKMLRMLGRNAQAIPGGKTPCADLSFRCGFFKGLGSERQAPPESRRVNRGPLRLDVVQVVEVNRLESQVRTAAVDLV